MTFVSPPRALLIGAMTAALLLSGCASDGADKAGAPGSAPSMQDDSRKTGAPIGVNTNAAEQIMTDNGYLSSAEYLKDPKKYGKAVLFFTGLSCAECKDLDKELSTKKLPEGLIVAGALLEESKELATKYGVTKPNTFVLVTPEGKELKKWQNSPNVADIAAKAKA